MYRLQIQTVSVLLRTRSCALAVDAVHEPPSGDRRGAPRGAHSLHAQLLRVREVSGGSIQCVAVSASHRIASHPSISLHSSLCSSLLSSCLPFDSIGSSHLHLASSVALLLGIRTCGTAPLLFDFISNCIHWSFRFFFFVWVVQLSERRISALII